MTTGQAVRARISELLKEKRMTEYGLIRRTGMPPSTVKSIMSGQSKSPGMVAVVVICVGLDISLRDFFDSELFFDIDGLAEEDEK